MTSSQHSDLPQADASISILVPSYNPGSFIREALQSALAQLGPDDEIVVQDAGSGDGTQDILREFGDADGRIRVVVEPDAGQSDALNRALARASKPWVLWMNADDVLLGSALDALREAIGENPGADVIAGGHQILRADGSVVDTFRARAFETSSIVCRGCSAFSGSILLGTDFLRALGGFENDLNTVMDLSLQLRIAAQRPRQVFVDAPIGALRFHETSKSATLWYEFARESHRVRMRYVHTPGLWLRAEATTIRHIMTKPLFRLKLRPEYRAVRRRIVQSVGR